MKREMRQMISQRGSALLVGLMVIAGLSLLGLGFVAISETENAISLNQRNATQVETVAEAGVRAVVEWFQSPQFTTSTGIMPLLNEADKNAMKKERFLIGGEFSATATGALTNIGRYEAQPNAEFFCCDRPFKPELLDRLFGTDEAPDIVIDRVTSTTSASVTVGAGAGAIVYTGTFLQRFNQILFPAGSEVRVTRIEIYGPPMINGTRNANNFWQSGDRYGLGTIRVTASKYRTVEDANAAIDPGGSAPDPIATRVVRAIVSEWPFPGPQGPIQSNANIQTGGNVAVHWGRMTAQGSMFIKRSLSGLPWFNARDRITYQYGYDSSKVWQGSTPYQLGDVVHPTASALRLRRAYVCVDPGLSNPAEPAWPDAGEIDDFDATPPPGIADHVRWRAVNRKPFPVLNLDILDRDYWLWTVLGKDVHDPWIEARSRGAITNAIVTALPPTKYHPFKYEFTTQDEFALPTAGLSNWFQHQTLTETTTPFDRREVVFPRIDYQFWKDLAVNGRGTEGVFYFRWVDGENFTDGRQTKNFAAWTDIEGGASPPGFYFFDTRNGQNPQVTGGTSFLTPGVEVNSSDSTMTWTMQGFIYLNAANFGTQGIRGVGGYYNFPGEPFLDIGYWKVDPSTMLLEENPAGAVAPDPIMHVIDQTKVRNRKHDHQELNGNNRFDFKVAPRTVTRPGESTPVTLWLPVPFYNGCTSFGQSGDCSEPHEPFLNLIYPATACCAGGGDPNPIRIGWEDPALQTRRPKKRVSPTILPDCTVSSQYEFCTSNEYDRDGYLDNWTAAQDAPVLDGVFYNEGDLNPTGNARYFGSLLIKGNVDSNGTNEVWFDERLIKDEWPPKEWPFPRVFVTALQTEN